MDKVVVDKWTEGDFKSMAWLSVKDGIGGLGGKWAKCWRQQWLPKRVAEMKYWYIIR